MKKISMIFTVTAALCLGIAAAALASESYDMEKSVKRALEANPQMSSARSQVLAAEAGAKSALGAFGPALTAGYTWTHFDKKPSSAGVTTGDQDVFTLDMNVHQPIFTGFTLLSTYEKAVLNKELTQAQLESTELSLIYSVQSNFLALLQARENVRSAEDSVARLKSQLQVINAFYEVGLKPKLDVLQAETDLATAEQTLIKAKNALDTQQARMNTLLGLPLEADVKYEGEFCYFPVNFSLDESLNKAYKNRPDLKIADRSIEMAKKDVTLATSSFYPQVSADFDYYKKGDDAGVSGSRYLREDSWQTSVGASWKLFEWGKSWQGRKQATETLAKIKSDYDNTKLEASYSVKSNMLAIENAAKRIVSARKGVDSAKENYRMAVARYQAQVGTNTDVLDAQSRLTTAEADLTQAMTDYQTSLAQFYVSIGEKHLRIQGAECSN